MLWKERIMDQTCQDCYDAAVAAYRKSALADISNMRPINTEEAIRSAVDAALDFYIKANRVYDSQGHDIGHGASHHGRPVVWPP